MCERQNIGERPLMVTIRCLAYNQEPYIRQCLEGFVMQKTNFRFEAVVHDDASTDGTAAIIREYAEKYPDIIKPIYETVNQYSKRDGSLCRIMDKHTHGKYVAYCEGDDYWIDPLKLQKQVDFMEAHSEYGLVHTYFNYVDTEGRVIPPPSELHQHIQERIFDGYIWDYYLQNPGFILTCTCLCRKSLYREDEERFLDTGLFMMIARQSKVHCIREVTSCYRRNPQGAMCSEHQHVSMGNKRALLHQIYYYSKRNPCAPFYKDNKRVCDAVATAYVRLLAHMSELPEADKMLLLKIMLIKPSLMFCLPATLLKEIVAKLRGRH